MSWKKAKLKAKKSKLNKYHTFNPDSNGGKEWRERQKNKPRNSIAAKKKILIERTLQKLIELH